MPELWELPGFPPTRLTRWRLGSRLAAGVDLLGVAAGAALFLVSAVDSVVSWPTDRVLLSESRLLRIALVLLIPFWIWMLFTSYLLLGRPRRDRERSRVLRRATRPGRRTRTALALGTAACLLVLMGGFVRGASLGRGHVLAGPQYQVSALGLESGRWTEVSASQYQHWQARFVRMDGVFTLFGLYLAGGSLGSFRLHGRYRRRGPGA